MKRPTTARLSSRLLMLLGTLAVSTQALAHAHLQSATPAEEADTDAPQRLELTFSEGLELAFSDIELSDAEGNAIELGDAALDNDDMTLIVPIDETLDAGEYTVEWQVLSVDGHQTDGRYQFTVTQ